MKKPDPSLRIVQVCPYSWDVPGGVQVHVRELAAHLRVSNERDVADGLEWIFRTHGMVTAPGREVDLAMLVELRPGVVSSRYSISTR